MGSDGHPASRPAGGETPTPDRSPHRDPAAGEGSSGGRSWAATHKRLLTTLVAGLLVAGFAYYVLPQIADLGQTLERLRGGNPRWFALAVPLEALSYACYVVLFHAVLSRKESRIGWGASYEIAMAGGGATKLLAAAGSGGVAVTVWALRASGMPSEDTAESLFALDILNYAVYMLALVIFGFGLWLGVFPGQAPVWLTLIPAVFGLVVILAALSMLWWAAPTERFMLRRAASSHGRSAGWWSKGAKVPRALQRGVAGAIEIARGHDRSWLAAIPAWGFDIAVLWASFRAFGDSPPLAPLIMGYYVGTLGNVLPTPGGIGGVEGGMVGSFLGFGVNGSLAVLAVLAYRTISYWLPALPEGAGYLQLRARVRRWREKLSGSGKDGGAAAPAPPRKR